MKLRLVINPAAGGGRARRLEPELSRWARLLDVEWVTSRDADHLRAEARRAVADGVDRLITVGGDGTFHQVIQGLAGSGCALGLVPLGTGNDLPACLAIPRRFDEALELALSGAVRTIDLGRAGDHWFALYCGLGFDSEVSRWIDRRGPGGKGPLIYVRGVLATLLRFQAPVLQVEHDGGSFERRAMLLSVSNAPRFGGGMKIAPGAELDDGELDLVFIDEVGRLEALTVFPRVYWGGHVSHPAVSVVRTRRARIASDREFLAYADGEPLATIGPEGLEIEIEPAALAVVAPP